MSQILADFDTVAKNDEIDSGAIFVSDQSVKFLLIPTPSRKMTKSPPRDFCFPSIIQILADSDTVTKNDEIAPAGFLFPINQSNFSRFRHRREK